MSTMLEEFGINVRTGFKREHLTPRRLCRGRQRDPAGNPEVEETLERKLLYRSQAKS
jgi:hypothetical protein